MKKLLNIPLALATVSLLASTGVQAHNHSVPEHKFWVGGSILKYNADSARPNDLNFYDEGFGVGLEAGLFINEKWSTRLDIMHTDSELYDSAPLRRIKATTLRWIFSIALTTMACMHLRVFVIPTLNIIKKIIIGLLDWALANIGKLPRQLIS